MEPHNKRFPQQWEIVSKHVDFRDKSVLDLGCGYGDMFAAVCLAGGRGFGLEGNPTIGAAARLRMVEQGVSPSLIWQMDIENIEESMPNSQWDVTICFSVLPYVDMFNMLKWMSDHSKTALIEVQYKGDGPGYILNDAEMESILRSYWIFADNIGKTLVEYRNTHRTIWLCD